VSEASPSLWPAPLAVARVDERGLGAMWVAPAWRGRGAAPMLADVVITWAGSEGAARLGLWVPADNPRARAFYEGISEMSLDLAEVPSRSRRH
jgi:GNAT superfamily N-acetyltransferase